MKTLTFLATLIIVAILLGGCSSNGKNALDKFQAGESQSYKLKLSDLSLKYDAVGQPRFLVGEKMAFLAVKDNKTLMVYDGVEISANYDEVAETTFRDIAGKLAFTAKKEGKWFIVYDGKIVEGTDQYKFVRPVEDSGKLAFIADKTGGKSVVILDGKQVGGEFDFFNSLTITKVGGRLAFVEERYMGNSGLAKDVVFYAGQELELGTLPNSGPDSIVDIGGKPAFMVQKENEKGQPIIPFGRFIYYDGKEIGESYTSLGNPVNIGGKLGFEAIKGKKETAVYDGQELGDYDYVTDLTSVNGKPAFFAGNDKSYFVVYDGNRIGSYNFTSLVNIQDLGGKLSFVASRNGKHVVYYDGSEFDGHDGVLAIGEIHGKLAFLTGIVDEKDLLKPSKSFLYYDGQLKAIEGYDFIIGSFILNDKLVLLAAKDTQTLQSGKYSIVVGEVSA